MKYLCVVFLSILMLPGTVFARKANFIEAHLLRLSSQQNPAQWLLPFSQTKNPTPVETNLMLSMEKDTYALFKDIQSQKQPKIQARLNQSFGKPYDLSAKLNFGYRYQSFSQFLSTNGGAVLLVTDPVFPELKGFLFHDYTATSAYIFKPLPRLTIKPQLSYGVRRYLDRKYSVGDLVDKKLDVKFEKAPYLGFMELNLSSIFSLSEWGQILFQVNSLPIKKNDYDYWDTFLGYKTPNFLKGRNWFLSEFFLYGGYSPVYGGEYDVSRTYKIGASTSLWETVGLDVFTMDDFYPAAIVSFCTRYLTLELYTFERAYDDFGHQRSRDYGINLKTTW